MRYDPLTGPDPEAWLGLDEGEQMETVLRYHKRMKARAGSLRFHAVIHATVETQLAQGHAGASTALERLLSEGLDRHEAVHAIGSVLAVQIHAAMQGKAFDAAEYERALAGLNLATWHRMAKEE